MIILNLIRISGIPHSFLSKKLSLSIKNFNTDLELNSGVFFINKKINFDDCDEFYICFKIEEHQTQILFKRKINNFFERHVILVEIEKLSFNLVFEIKSEKEVSQKVISQNENSQIDDYYKPKLLACIPFF